MSFRFVICISIPAILLLAAVALLRAPARAEATLPNRNLSLLTPRQWESVFAVAAGLPLPQRVALWADLAAVDGVYAGDPLGEGPGATPDPDPLCDFARVDCVTYVEQVYALALSPSRARFDDTLRRIRYREGRVDFRWRNHYAVSDWLPANAWFITDVTAEVGGKHVSHMTKRISRARFFTGKGLAQYADLPDEEAATAYIPRRQVREIAGALNSGDLAIFVVSTPGIIAGHVGLLRVEKKGVMLQHAGLAAKAVVTAPLLDYVNNLPERFVGMKIARPFEKAEETPPPPPKE